MIYVVAVITCKPGMRDAFLEAFRTVVPVVRAEAGCIEYAPTIDADTGISGQDSLGPDRFAVIEKWESVAALQAHDSSEHMSAFRSRIGNYVQAREIRMLIAV